MIYEYKCACCDHEWEEEQSIKAPPLEVCPKCKVAAAKRLVSGGQGFRLAGDGWYRDGYSKTSSE